MRRQATTNARIFKAINAMGAGSSILQKNYLHGHAKKAPFLLRRNAESGKRLRMQHQVLRDQE